MLSFCSKLSHGLPFLLEMKDRVGKIAHKALHSLYHAHSTSHVSFPTTLLVTRAIF